MSTQHTPNYQLCQWIPEDAVIRTDFNEDNEKLDAALRGLQASKADQTALTTLQTTVGQKANQSALSELQAKVEKKAEQSTVSALQITVGQKANQSDFSALQAVVGQKAEQSALNALQATVYSKADSSTLSTLTTRVGNVEAWHAADVAALRGENCWVALKRVRLAYDSASFSVPFSGIDLSKYRQLEIHVRVHSSGSTDILFNQNTNKIYVSDNGNTYPQLSYMHLNILGSGTINIHPHDNDTFICGLQVHNLTATNFYTHSIFTGVRLNYYTLSSIDFVAKANYVVHAGSEVWIYGLKSFG